MSLAIHACVSTVVLLGVHLNADLGPRPVIYRVNLIEPQLPAPVVEPEPEPEPELEPPLPVPQQVPPVQVRARRPQTAEVRPPAAAPPQPISIDERRRERRQPEPEPPAPAPVPTPPPPPEEPEPRPRGKSTQVSEEAEIFAEFAYYRVAMRNKISALWSPPRASTELVCAVRFRIVRSGAVIGARIERSSGLPFFDHTALRAVSEASPLMPLPTDFPRDVVVVSFEFAYKP